MGNAAPNVVREFFGGLPDGRAVERVVLRGAGGFEAHIITYGAALQALVVPDLTNHSFFNLEGAAAGVDILSHRLTIAADRFLAIDPDAIPLPEQPRSARSALS